MVRRLADFYRTKEWEKLRVMLRLERTDENGDVICEYCKRPIIKAYDCIAHHKEALTETNVNNAAISLNPDNIALVHHACHNKIHERVGYKRREVYLVYGPPLAGKTTWTLENMNRGDLICDIDRVWECLSGRRDHDKPESLNANVFSIRAEIMQQIKTRTGRWSNAYIVGGYPLISERERIARETGAREIFINTNKETCIKRLEEQDDRDKKQYREYIEDWFRKYTPRGSAK